MSFPSLVLELSQELPSDARRSIRLAIPTEFDVTELRKRNFGPDTATLLIILKDAAAVAGGVAAISNLITALIKWREAHKDKLKQGVVYVKAEGESRIDLSGATASELQAALKERLKR